MTTNFHVLPRFGGPKYMSTAPEYLYEWYKLKGLLPDNPAGFTIRKTDPSQGQKPKGPIRILIDSRRQMRKLLNHAELLKKCNQSPGLECRGWTFDDDFLKLAPTSSDSSMPNVPPRKCQLSCCAGLHAIWSLRANYHFGPISVCFVCVCVFELLSNSNNLRNCLSRLSGIFVWLKVLLVDLRAEVSACHVYP